MTRADAGDFLALAAELTIKPEVTVFALEHVNDALRAVKDDSMNGAAVIAMT
jgi:propanol-preferring alcohol dehydrogenase